MRNCLGIFLLLFLAPTVSATPWSAASSAEQSQLVELFTSQGCSSCPSADRWLSALKKREDLWRGVVPVAWHVTYWDYLGWRDPFALEANDRRQRRLAAGIRAGVYTPGVFRNGAEWRSWRTTSSGWSPGETLTVGILSAQGDDHRVQVQFQPATDMGLDQPRVELVFLRTGLRTPVKAGENRGRELAHDFIAGDVTSVPMRAQDGHWVAEIAASPNSDSEAVALWVIDQQGNYLQATGGWLH